MIFFILFRKYVYVMLEGTCIIISRNKIVKLCYGEIIDSKNSFISAVANVNIIYKTISKR